MHKFFIWPMTALASCLLLAACGGGASGFTPTASPTATTINGIPVPPAPGPANDATLAGIDANHNGVRDDVERAIAERYGSNIQQWKSEMQTAAAMQSQILADGNLLEGTQANLDAMKAGDCGVTTFFGNDTSQITKSLEFVFYLSVDTPQRYAAFEATANLNTPDHPTPESVACTWPSP